jgi:hypothetical protein
MGELTAAAPLRFSLSLRRLSGSRLPSDHQGKSDRSTRHAHTSRHREPGPLSDSLRLIDCEATQVGTRAHCQRSRSRGSRQQHGHAAGQAREEGTTGSRGDTGPSCRRIHRSVIS